MQLGKDIAAVVPGGASGLGAATARALAAKGVRVALLDVNADAGEKLAKELSGIFAKCDVTSEPSVDAALAGVDQAKKLRDACDDPTLVSIRKEDRDDDDPRERRVSQLTNSTSAALGPTDLRATTTSTSRCSTPSWSLPKTRRRSPAPVASTATWKRE